LGVTVVEKWATWPETVKNLGITKGIILLLTQECRADHRIRVYPSTGPVNTTGRKNVMTTECVSRQSDVSNGNTLLLLVDTGADISLLKPDDLDKTRQFDPKGRVKVKCDLIHHSDDGISTGRYV